MRLFFLLLIILYSKTFGAAISGIVYNFETKEPIPFVTLRVLGSSHSTSTNENGLYRINLSSGLYTLKFSHVAYHSEKVNLTVNEENITQNIYLKPATIEVGSYKVLDRKYDPGQQIILEAIKHKDEILSKIKKYKFDAYTKLIIHELLKEDSSQIMFLTETQLTGQWQYPDNYKEIIIARKQTANIKAENNLITVGEILNFNKNRLDLNTYQIVSPTAKDALDYYNYYLLDSLFIDNQIVFLLEIEPKSEIIPLFEGFIKIADSTYDVVGIDVTLNQGFDSQFLSDIHLQQIYTEFENNYWMPVMINFKGNLNINFPGIPEMDFDYTALLHNFDFNPQYKNEKFDEFVLEVDKNADNIDSSDWNARQLIPLTNEEIYGYHRIDSVVNTPKPIYKRFINYFIRGLFYLPTARDYFHFNRVEGFYLGFKYNSENLYNRWGIKLKSGYAFDSEYYQHNYNLFYRLSKKQKLTIGLGYHDKIKTRETILSPVEGNATLLAITNKTDPYDYFYEKGWTFYSSTKLWNQTRFSIKYNDVNQSSASNTTEFSLFRKDKEHRPNPSIVDGKLRSLKTSFTYDSRKFINNKGQTIKLPALNYTFFEISAEYSSDNWLGSDFDFRRYRSQFFTTQAFWGGGQATFDINGGISDGFNLVPQKYFVVDFGRDIFESVSTFHTLGESNFYGSRFFSVYSNFNFGRYLFKKSRLPIIKNLPFGLSIHGGAFWSDFNNNQPNIGDELLKQAPNAYSEIGFGINRLPLFLRIDFTWQLSAYSTNKFSLSIDMEM